MRKFTAKLLNALTLFVLITNGLIAWGIYSKPQYFLGTIYDYYLIKASYQNINEEPSRKNDIIGDSRGTAGVNPDILGSEYINLSIPGANFFEGYITVKRRLEVSTIDTLIAVYGLNFFENTIWTDLRTIPFRFATRSELNDLKQLERKERSLVNENMSLGYPELISSQFKRDLRFCRVPMVYSSTFRESFIDFIRLKDNDEKGRLLIEYNGHISFGTADSSNEARSLSESTEFRPGKVNMAYLDSIISICNTNGIQFFLCIPPVNESTWMLPENKVYIENAMRYFEFNFPQYTIQNAHFLANYYFGDRTHLNRLGSELFSEQIRYNLTNFKYETP